MLSLLYSSKFYWYICQLIRPFPRVHRAHIKFTIKGSLTRLNIHLLYTVRTLGKTSISPSSVPLFKYLLSVNEYGSSNFYFIISERPILIVGAMNGLGEQLRASWLTAKVVAWGFIECFDKGRASLSKVTS